MKVKNSLVTKAENKRSDGGRECASRNINMCGPMPFEEPFGHPVAANTRYKRLISFRGWRVAACRCSDTLR